MVVIGSSFGGFGTCESNETKCSKHGLSHSFSPSCQVNSQDLSVCVCVCLFWQRYNTQSRHLHNGCGCTCPQRCSAASDLAFKADKPTEITSSDPKILTHRHEPQHLSWSDAHKGAFWQPLSNKQYHIPSIHIKNTFFLYSLMTDTHTHTSPLKIQNTIVKVYFKPHRLFSGVPCNFLVFWIKEIAGYLFNILELMPCCICRW